MLKPICEYALNQFPGGYEFGDIRVEPAAHRVLLLLDNCDRIAAPLGNLVSLLLGTSGELRALATSQQRMGLVDPEPENCLSAMPVLMMVNARKPFGIAKKTDVVIELCDGQRV